MQNQKINKNYKTEWDTKLLQGATILNKNVVDLELLKYNQFFSLSKLNVFLKYFQQK